MADPAIAAKNRKWRHDPPPRPVRVSAQRGARHSSPSNARRASPPRIGRPWPRRARDLLGSTPPHLPDSLIDTRSTKPKRGIATTHGYCEPRLGPFAAGLDTVEASRAAERELASALSHRVPRDHGLSVTCEPDRLRPPLPALSVDDVARRPPVRMNDRRKRAIGRVSEGD